MAGQVVLTSCGILDASGTTYVLQANLIAPSGLGCFSITADGVTLDGNGFALAGLNPDTGPNSTVTRGIQVSGAIGVTIKDLKVTNFNVGIFLGGLHSNITGTFLHDNTHSGIFLGTATTAHIITNNRFDGTGFGVYAANSGGGNEIYNNNFFNNGVSLGGSDIFDKPLPVGGNYWAAYDTPPEGCNDTNSDGICDAPYQPFVLTDNLPWTTPNGWVN